MSLNNRQTHRAALVAANIMFYGCYHSPWLNAFAHWLATPYLSENINSTVLNSVFLIFLLSFFFFLRNALIAASLASWSFSFLTVSTFCWFQWSEFRLALKDPSWTAWEGFFFIGLLFRMFLWWCVNVTSYCHVSLWLWMHIRLFIWSIINILNLTAVWVDVIMSNDLI